MRVPAKMTPRAVLLWAIAAVLALALAYWDLSDSSASGAETPPVPEDVEIEVVYEEGE